MSDREIASIGWREIGYFLAEVAAYVGVAWWSLAREGPLLLRLLLAVGLLAIFATSWAMLVSPKAVHPLRGRADTAFRVIWFGLAIAAAISLILGR